MGGNMLYGKGRLPECLREGDTAVIQGETAVRGSGFCKKTAVC